MRCGPRSQCTTGTFVPHGPPNSLCAAVAVTGDVRIGPEVGQVQHHEALHFPMTRTHIPTGQLCFKSGAAGRLLKF
jgi:hypothetical protein